MYQFFTYLAIFSAGWIAKSILFNYHLSDNPEKIQSLIDKIKESSRTNSIRNNSYQLPVKFVQIGTIIYVYTLDGKFVSQGKTMDDAISIAMKRFPDAEITF